MTSVIWTSNKRGYGDRCYMVLEPSGNLVVYEVRAWRRVFGAVRGTSRRRPSSRGCVERSAQGRRGGSLTPRNAAARTAASEVTSS
jgi:hypothetical protein